MTLPTLFIILGIAAVIDAIWIFGLWFGWPQKLQQSTNGSGHTWLLLDLFGFPRIEENCTALAKGYFIAGISLATLGAIVAYGLMYSEYFLQLFS
jgi:hypothetical protein